MAIVPLESTRILARTAALATLLALACRKPPPPSPATTATTATTTPSATRPDPAPTPTTSLAPSIPDFPAPTWLADLPPRTDSPVDDGFLLAYYANHQRVTRDGAPLFTLASLGVTTGSILELAPLGDAVVLWLHSERRFIALLWTPTATRTLATSRSGAFAVQGDAILYARGPEIVEQSITGIERTRQRFPAGSVILRLGAVGRDVLALIETGPTKHRRQDLHLLERPTPLVRDVHLNAVLANSWSLHTNQRGNFTVGEAGQLGLRSDEVPRDLCSTALCVRSVRASALVQLDARGRMRRLTRWIADPEQNASDHNPAPRPHHLTAIRGIDGTGLRFREAPDLPWRAVTDAAPIVAPATPNATETAVIGERMVVAEDKHLRVFGPGPAERTLARPDIGGDLIADGEYVTLVSRGADRVTVSLDGPAAPANTTQRLLHPDGPHTLDVNGQQWLTLDGRPLPFRPPEGMRGDHSPMIDGIFAVPGAPKALLTMGRQSAHGGHYVHDRVLALNLGDGDLRRVGPDGAWPLGERSHQRFGVWRSLFVDPNGRWLLMRTDKSIMLAPLDGGVARPVVGWSPDDVDPSQSADRERWATIHQGQLIFADFAGTVVRPRTRPLRHAWLTWAPSGRAFVTAGPGNNHLVRDDGSIHPLACKGEITRVLEVLPDARAALVDHEGTIHLAAADVCLPLGLPQFALVPRGQRHLDRPPS